MKPKYWAIFILATIAIGASALYYTKLPAWDLGLISFHHKTQSSPTSETDLKDWKTYTNSQYGFSFKYPPTLYTYDNKPYELFTIQNTPKQIVFGELFNAKGQEGVDFVTQGYQFNFVAVKEKKDFEESSAGSTYKIRKLSLPNIQAIRYDDEGGVSRGPVVAIVDQNSPSDYILFNYLAQGDETSNWTDDQVEMIFLQILSTFKFAK